MNYRTVGRQVAMIKLAKSAPIELDLHELIKLAFDPGGVSDYYRQAASAGTRKAKDVARTPVQQLRRINYLRNKLEAAKVAAGGTPKIPIAQAVRKISKGVGSGRTAQAAAKGIASKLPPSLGTRIGRGFSRLLRKHPLVGGLGTAGLMLGAGYLGHRAAQDE